MFRYDAETGQVVGVPLNPGGEGDQVSLTLFGTGIRVAGGARMVRATVGGSEAPVLSAGAQNRHFHFPVRESWHISKQVSRA